MRRILLLFTMCFALLGSAYAQQVITGKVSDGEGLGIPGTMVVQKGTSNGTTTDVDGNYSIKAPADAVLVFSFVGMKSQELSVNGRTFINVTLATDAVGVDEVVVTALGIKRDQKALGYALTQVNADVIVKASNDNIMRSLYGKAPGLQISSNSGSSTSGVKINIRGINTLYGTNRPLIIVDGIPIVDSDSQFNGRNDVDPGSAINDINTEDIASFSVLKGANAAALYGSQAANGVILIETKKGSKSSKGMGVTFSSTTSLESVAVYEDLQNEFGAGSNSMLYQIQDENGNPVYIYPGAVDPSTGSAPVSATTASFGARMNGQQTLWWDGKIRPYSPQKDNVKDLYRQGFTSSNTVALDNGWDKGSYRASFTRKDYQSVIDGHEQASNNVSLSLNADLHERIKLVTSLNYYNIGTVNRPIRTDRMVNYGMPRSEITSLLKEHTVNDDGLLYTSEASNLSGNLRDNTMFPLFWIMKQRERKDLKNRIIANAELTFTITDFLSLRAKAGGDMMFTEETFQDPWQTTAGSGSRYRKDMSKDATNYYETLAIFNKKINDDFTLSGNLGWSYTINMTTSQYASTAGGLTINKWYSLSNSKNAVVGGGSRAEDRLMAVFGSAALDYKSFNFLELTYRYDNSSILPPENAGYDYWSASNSFIFTDAFELPSWFTYGKFRASYALVGLPGQRYFANDVYSYGTYNGATTNSFSSTVPPVNLRREMQKAMEFGLETWFWNRRLGVDLTYYQNRNTDMIMPLSIPASTGASNLSANFGEMRNTGLELALNFVPVKTRDFTWSATLNMATANNEIVELIEGMDDYFYKIGDMFGVQGRSEIGGSYADIYTYTWKRNDAGQMIVSDNGYYVQDTNYKKVGNALPDVFGGFINNLTYKNFDFNFALDYSFGGDIVSQTNLWGTGYGRLKSSLPGRDEATGGLPYYRKDDGNGSYTLVPLDSHSSSAPADAYNNSSLYNDELIVYHDGMILDGVKADGTPNTTMVSASSYYSNRYATFNSEDGVYDNSYIKLRELALSYRIPSAITQRVGIKNAQIGVFGRNLFYLYKSVPNIDPESSMGTTGVASFLEITPYPSTRSYGFNLRFNF